MAESGTVLPVLIFKPLWWLDFSPQSLASEPRALAKQWLPREPRPAPKSDDEKLPYTALGAEQEEIHKIDAQLSPSSKEF